MKKIFTPILDGKRVKVEISKIDFSKLSRGPGYKGIITDTKSKKKYDVYGRPCDCPECFCDIEIRPIILDENHR